MEDNQQQPYQNQPPQNYQANPYLVKDTRVMSVSDWMVTILLMIIPLVNIILLFVWAFSSGTNLNKANWAKASLIWFAIIFVLYLFILAIIGAAFFG